MSPSSAGRYSPELWQAYVKANKARGRQEGGAAGAAAAPVFVLLVHAATLLSLQHTHTHTHTTHTQHIHHQAYTEKVVEECATDADYVWIHDYHLLAMPSLLRKRFNKIRCGGTTGQ